MEILQYLLEQGGDVNLVDNEGCSPLHHLAAGPRSPRQGTFRVCLFVCLFTWFCLCLLVRCNF